MSNENINIRLMKDTAEDYTLMAKWLTDPVVLQYYEGRDNPHNIDKIKEKYAPRVLKKDCVIPCIIQLDNKDIGYIQYYQITEDEKSEYGYDRQENMYVIDLFIGEPEYWNKGIGTRTLKGLIEMLKSEKDADMIVIDPQTWNVRAISCYEKVGFRKVKLLKKHELHEGEYRDSWLMEIKL